MAYVPTNCNAIDSAMGGGFQTGIVTELTGESGIGKTQICLQAITTSILPVELGGLGASAMVISYVAPFPARRLTTMVKSRAHDDLAIVHSALANVTCVVGGTPAELRELLSDTYNKIKQIRDGERAVKVVVLDSVYGFITHQFPDISDGCYFRTQYIKNIGYTLGKIAEDHNVAMIVCNSAVELYNSPHPQAFLSSGRWKKPGVGILWDNYVKIRYLLTKEMEEGATEWVRIFQVMKENACIARCTFAITSEGVV